MTKRNFDRIASKVGAANNFVTDRQTAKQLEFVERAIIDDQKINVLVMGASGAGKSTLINATLGAERAKVGDGEAVTRKTKLYERKDLPFRLIDTAGLEYSIRRQEKVKRQLAGWSEEGLTRKDMTKLIHVIWFCIDAQSKRVSKESLDYLYRISKLWDGIPIVVVFTKSFASSAIGDNEKMFAKVLRRYRKRRKLNVRAVVSVVAKDLTLDKHYCVKAYGVEDLCNVTTGLISDAKDINETIMVNMSYQMRRDTAKKYVDSAKRSSFTVSVLPTKRGDSEYLEPIQESMIDNIAKAFALSEDERAQMTETIESSRVIVKVGQAAAKGTKRVPLLNGIVASKVTELIGHVAIRTAEKIHKSRE